ncbi:MAG: phospholipase A2 [Nocardioides sp.]|nr:phospholipase A2 [Nocardioides sp.]
MLRLLATSVAALTGLTGLLLPPSAQAVSEPATAVTATAAAAPAAAYARAQIRARANDLMFDMTLAQFMKVKNRAKSGVDTEFNWSDDGCSGPPNPFSDNFRRSCLRHDFGFRNYGNGLQLRPHEKMRLKINRVFRADMNNQCSNQGNPTGCARAVSSYFHFVNDLNNGAAAFYDDTCDVGYLCLYDDDDRVGWRVQLGSRSDDFHEFAGGDVNDNVKSVWNRDSRAWRVFQNPGYGGNSECVSAGEVEDFGSFDGLNDELSAARPGC